MTAADRHALDAVAFAEERLGFVPDRHQAMVLNPAVHRGLLNCSRQWGKSTVTAVKAVHRAYTQKEALVVVVSPSGRQSGEFLWKVGDWRAGSECRCEVTGRTNAPCCFRTDRGLWACRAMKTQAGGSPEYPCCWWMRRHE